MAESGPWEDFQAADISGPWEDFAQPQQPPEGPAQGLQAPVARPDTESVSQWLNYGSPTGEELNQAAAGASLPPFAEGFAGALKGLVPTSLGQVGELAASYFPPIGAVQGIKQGYDIATGTPPEQAVPGIGELKDVETIRQQLGGDSPEYQRAAGRAGGDITAQMIMAALIGRGITPKPKVEVAPETATEKPPIQAETPQVEGTPEMARAQPQEAPQAQPASMQEFVMEGNYSDGTPVSYQIFAPNETVAKATFNRLRSEPGQEPIENFSVRAATPEEKGLGHTEDLQSEPPPATIPKTDELGRLSGTAADEIPTGEEPARHKFAPPPEPASVEQPGGATGGEGPGISIKNAYTDAQREALGFPEAVKEARRDFGSVWEEAETTAGRDPGAGSRLVESINEGKTKALSDHDNALLLREQIAAQSEHTNAVDAVNKAATDADRTAAKARLEIARNRLQAVYDADRKAGRSTGQGLNARKMLAAEDYSLAAMEARKRAANDGRPLSELQASGVKALHDKIAELSARLDKLQESRLRGVNVAREATAARKSGKRLIDYTGEAAAQARARIQRQLHGLGAKPAPPTLLYDYAVVGADHLARGLTKFSDWSAQMVKDFGERVKPHLQDIWKRARAIHDSAARAFRTPEERNLERYKTRMAQDTVGYTAKIERGDFTKAQRKPIALDPAAFKMKANLQRLKNEFERGVAKDAYRNKTPGDKFWEHFVGVERAMKLSSPAVFEKLGLAAGVREAGLAPLESASGYAASKFFPKLAKGTRYGAGLKAVVRSEIKAKAAMFTEGMKDAYENIKGKESALDAMSDKYGRQPDFWYHRIGKIHAAIKAPVKRAEFTRSLELRMDAAVKAGEDINHPAVMDRLATESALDANRAIFQQNTVVSKLFSMLDKASPAGGRVARFLFPVVKIPVNLFKELVTYNLGAPAAAVKIGRAYLKGVETLPALEREAIIRQLAKGSVGGAAILWGYYNSDKVHKFFKSMPPLFQHTPVAMAINEGSIIKMLEEPKNTEGRKELATLAKYDIPFMYTVTGLADALDPKDPHGWQKYLYSMIQGSTVPQISSWTAKELDKPTPFSFTQKPTFRPPQNITQAIEQGIPGLRQNVPAYKPKQRGQGAWERKFGH